MSTTIQQERYEVRFDWGSAGLRSVADGAGIIIVVQGIADGHPISTLVASHGRERGDGALVDAARESGARVLAASLRNRTAVAQHVLHDQLDRGERVRVAVIAEVATDASGPAAAGSAAATSDAADSGAAGSGFCVDALFAAGAVIDALAAVGIDYSSPEAAAASAAFTGLERAVGHLFTASAAGQRLIAEGRRDAVVAAGQVDASELVPVLGDAGYWAVG